MYQIHSFLLKNYHTLDFVAAMVDKQSQQKLICDLYFFNYLKDTFLTVKTIKYWKDTRVGQYFDIVRNWSILISRLDIESPNRVKSIFFTLQGQLVKNNGGRMLQYLPNSTSHINHCTCHVTSLIIQYGQQWCCLLFLLYICSR